MSHIYKATPAKKNKKLFQVGLSGVYYVLHLMKHDIISVIKKQLHVVNCKNIKIRNLMNIT